jgi:hypothetical protein
VDQRVLHVPVVPTHLPRHIGNLEELLAVDADRPLSALPVPGDRVPRGRLAVGAAFTAEFDEVEGLVVFRLKGHEVIAPGTSAYQRCR